MAADIKEVLQEKGELIAIGAAGALLLGYAIFAFGLSSDDELKSSEGKVAAARDMLNSNPAPPQDKIDFSALLATWTPAQVAKGEGQRGWVALSKPKVTANVKARPDKPVVPEEEKPRVVLAPVIAPAETELGQVTLKWTDGKKPGTPVAPASEYQVFRQEAGKGWEMLEKVPGIRKAFIDKSVQPKKKYAYKVMLITKAKTVDGKQESEFSQVVEATIPSGTAILYTGGSPQAANITVRKFMGGDWKERKFVVFPKDEEKNRTGDIGKIEKERNADTGKMEDVDYRTGFVLLEIRKDKFKYKRIERKSKIVDGQLETEEVEVDAEKERYKCVYNDDEGKPKEVWMTDEKGEDGDK